MTTFLAVLLGICVLAHVWMMFKGHGNHGGHSNAPTENKPKNKHKHGGCCH